VKTLKGYGVELRTKISPQADNQTWSFTANGYVVPKSHEDFALTNLTTITVDETATFTINGIKFDGDQPFVAFAGICPRVKLESPFIRRQW
jgi:hypothetical protein